METMIFGLMGGLGLFLFGMKMMGDGLERVAGDKLRGLLNVLTKNRLLGVLVGAGFTMLIQSSSATTVMVVGFVNAGLMNLLQATGVIMGANFGTSITAQLAAFHLNEVAPVALLAGVVMMLFFKRSMTQRIGTVIAGFGILFVGMDLMSKAMAPLRTDPGFMNLMQTVATNPLPALLTGVVVTCVIQSSSASIVLVQLLAQQGLISLEMSLYICLGCAIGTCITAMLASIGTTRTARRAAVVHLLYNIFGSSLMAIALQFLPLADWVRALPGEHNVMREIANAMMIMKLTEVLIFFPFADLLAKLACRIVPGEDPKPEENRVYYLDPRIISTPPIAVAQAVKEVERMGKVAIENLARAMRGFMSSDLSESDTIMRNEELTNYLNHEITKYLVRISQEDLNPKDSTLVGTLYHVINDLERVGDHAENVLEYTQSMHTEGIKFSEQALGELRGMYDRVHRILLDAMVTFHTRETGALSDIHDQEERIDDEEKRLQQAHIDRLSAGQCTAQAGMIFSELLSNLERVADHATNIAFSVSTEGEPD